jgi:ribose 5-phosphate isomerase B
LKVAIGCDHGGVDLKESVVEVLEEMGAQVKDFGANSTESVDYPDFARGVALSVVAGESDRGILLCGTGIGMSIAANKIPGIRAALCHDVYSARLTREHNDSNVLVMGARVIGSGLCQEIVKTWLSGQFSGGRHVRRVEKISHLEQEFSRGGGCCGGKGH